MALNSPDYIDVKETDGYELKHFLIPTHYEKVKYMLQICPQTDIISIKRHSTVLFYYYYYYYYYYCFLIIEFL